MGLGCLLHNADDLAHPLQSLIGLAAFAQDHEVVRIGDDSTAKAALQPQFLPPQHKPPHVQIRQQRRDRGALRDAAPVVPGFGRALRPSSIIGFFDRAFQPHLDQMQHTPVHDASRERQHQFGVGNAAEIVREVGVNDVCVAKVQAILHLHSRLLGIAARPIGRR